MKRTFKTVDYDQALDLTVRLGDCLPPEHLARFVVDSVAQLDLSALYAHYGSRGGEPKDLFVQVLLLAQEAGVLKLGTISLDGTKIHADASKHNAVSYKRLLEVEAQLRSEVEELFALSEQSDQPAVPDGLVVRDEIARREDRLVRLT